MYMNDGNKTKINLRNKSVFITGVAGFIGSNLAKRLLSTVEGVKVVGLDNMNHYYDVRLKEARLNELEQFDNFSFVKGNLADKAVIESIFEQYKPEIVVNLGAQAGVRYSITNPDAYVEANLIGFYNILEACRHSYDEGHTPVEHLVYASSSSVYGSNKKVPYSTDDKVDNPVSLYAATKKSNELMAHAYSKLYNIPSTGLRFFTVYGPAGRPDLFMATKVRYNEEPDVFKSLEGSLTRLRREHIDLLQLHGDYYTKELTDTLLQPGGMVEQMCRAKQEGLVQYLGFTGECQNAEFYRLIDTGIFDVVQVQYNVLFQHPYDPFFQSGSMYYCEEKGMGIVTMRSLTSGIFQKWMRIIQPDNTFDYSKALIQYVLSNPLVDTALLGMRSVAQVEENVAVCLDTAHRIDLAELHKRKVD